MNTCRNHPDQPAHARGLCHTCYSRGRDRPPPPVYLPVGPPPPGTWVHDAACAYVGGDAFFGREDEERSEAGARIRHAKAVCYGCPVQEPCLEYALRHREYGIWAGTTEGERRTIRERRRRGAA